MNTSSYQIAWVCALPTEMASAIGMLDEEYTEAPLIPNDQNNYIFGRIGAHNIVIICLPAGRLGIGPWAAVITKLVAIFRHLRFAILVGVGGAAPRRNRDIRLGDVVVSQPDATAGGVIQYDSGKLHHEKRFEQTGALNSPLEALLEALARLRARHLLRNHSITEHISSMVSKNPKLKSTVKYLGTEQDVLFKPDYVHKTKKI